MTERRMKNRSGKKIISEYLCVDDYGNEVFRCQFTGLTVHADDFIALGPFIDCGAVTYVCHPTAMSAYKAARREFDEFEANCNTCKNLIRLPHESRAGSIRGTCQKLKRKNNFVSIEFFVHPGDPMFMQCWEAR